MRIFFLLSLMMSDTFARCEEMIPCPVSRWDTVTTQFDYSPPPAGPQVDVNDREYQRYTKLSALEARRRALDLRHGRGMMELGDERDESYVVVDECHRIPVLRL